MPWSLIIGSAYMLFPLISASIVIGIIEKRNIFKNIGLAFTFNRWFIVAWLSPFFITCILFVVMLLMPDIKFSLAMETTIARLGSNMTSEQLAQIKKQYEMMPIHPVLISLVQAIIFGPTINAMFAFGEEAGWRGLMHRARAKIAWILERIDYCWHRLGILAYAFDTQRP